MSKSTFGETLGTMIKCLMKSYYPSRPAYVIGSCQWRLAVEIFFLHHCGNPADGDRKNMDQVIK